MGAILPKNGKAANHQVWKSKTHSDYLMAVFFGVLARDNALFMPILIKIRLWNVQVLVKVKYFWGFTYIISS